MRNIVLLFFYLLLNYSVYSVNNYSSDSSVWLPNQEAIDNFAKNHPNLTIIEGDLVIGDYCYANEDINNLLPLSKITTIEGDLVIAKNLALKNLKGLHHVEIVNGNVSVSENQILLNLNGFENLIYTGQSLNIVYNINLEDINGLQQLIYTNGLNISGNEKLNICNTKTICDLIINSKFLPNFNGNATDCNHLNLLKACNFFERKPNTCFPDSSQLPLFSYYYKQEELDSFLIKYPNCTEIYGRVALRNSINDLQPLRNINTIRGDFELEVIHPRNLKGLENLETIGGSFKLYDLTILKNFNELKTLKHIGEHLSISSCNNLVDNNGLNKLKTIGKQLRFKDNRKLQTISNFDSLDTVGSIFIESNNSLIGISGFKNLRTIFDKIEIQHNESLKTIDGFENLKSVGVVNNTNANYNIEPVAISIYNNAQLNSLNRFNLIEHINGSFVIENNLTLNNISGFDSLKNINGNFILKDLGIDNLSFCSNVEKIKKLELTNIKVKNLEGLNNLTEIECALNVNLNSQLENFVGLDKLQNCLKNLNIYKNNKLKSYLGTELLDSINNLNITGNDSLPKLEFSNNLKVIENLRLVENNIIKDLSGLERFDHFSTISLVRNKSLESLKGLDNLKKIFSLGIVECDNLENLNGLQNLDSIQGALSLRYNDKFNTLKHLQNLQSLSQLLIYGNENLIDLSGLENIYNLTKLSLTETNINSLSALENVDSIFSSVTLSENPHLNNFTDLKNIRHMRDISLSDNKNFISFEGLENIAALQRLNVLGDNALTNFMGLDGLKSVNVLLLRETSKIKTLDGLENLNHLKTLYIWENEVLYSLEAFKNSTITDTLFSNVKIYGNQNLSMCSTENICNFLSEEGKAEVYNNLLGCNSVDEILENCVVPINELVIESEILLTPNPTFGLMSLESHFPLHSYTIYDAEGRKVKKVKYEFYNKIDISNLHSGVYYILFDDYKRNLMKKVVKL